jgi:acyl-coenzyme A thioesterase PaaI-like protein
MSNSAFVPPEGFEEHVSPSNFVLAQGPMYKRQREDGSTIIGVRVLEQHLNLHGIAHGGFVATVVDNAIGYNVATALAVSIVTAHMNIDYLSSARLGTGSRPRCDHPQGPENVLCRLHFAMAMR